jgi:hypothetical protein
MSQLPRLTICIIVAAVVAIGLLMTSLPTAIVLTLPVAVAVLLVRWTGGLPATGPASFDARRVERLVSRIVIVLMILAVIYILFG